MLVVSGVLILEQESVLLLIIKTIVGLVTPESGLVQVENLTIPVRVETSQKKGQIMETDSSKRWATFLSAKTLDRKITFAWVRTDQ